MDRRKSTPPDHGRALGWLLVIILAVIFYGILAVIFYDALWIAFS